MARIVKKPAVRRNEILDVAQRLIVAKGYERMMIQDILDELNLSKGGFYYYFDSKLALCSALIERMQGQMEHSLLALAHDPQTPALTKLSQVFATLFRLKTGQKDILLALLRAWYTDENAVFRQKAEATLFQKYAPLLEEIIHQGIQDGVLTIPSADQLGRIVLVLIQDLSDWLAAWLLSDEPQEGNLQQIGQIISIYTSAIERVLGAPDASLQIYDLLTLNQWMDTSRETVSSSVSGKETRND
jgi:AcrR family transcriptional regulator